MLEKRSRAKRWKEKNRLIHERVTFFFFQRFNLFFESSELEWLIVEREHFFLLQKGLKHLVFQVCPWIWYKFHKSNDTLNELLSVTSEHMIHAFNKDPLHSCYFPTEILCVTLSCAPLVWTSHLSIWHTALTLLPSACASCALGHLYLNDCLKRFIFSLPLHWNSVQRKTENDSHPSGCCAEKKSNGNNLKRLNY